VVTVLGYAVQTDRSAGTATVLLRGVTVRRRVLPALAAALLAASLGACSTKQPSPTTTQGEPIVIGSTLPLTGAFAATGIIHKIAGEEFIDRLNANGGLLGRPVQWRLLDDQSNTANIDTLYEQLLSGPDPVDLIIGPYATPNILAAMAVAQRHSKIMPYHTAVLRPQLTYPCAFPGWSIGANPNKFIPEQLFDLVATLPNPPKRIAIATVQNGSAAFVTDGFPTAGDTTGVPTVAADRGLQVVLNEHYAIGTTNFDDLAQKVKNANPDLFISNSLGVDTVNQLNAMKTIGYTPPLTFSLFPAPGPLLGLNQNGILAWSLFEDNQPVIDRIGGDAQSIVDEFRRRADEANVAYKEFETQAAASWNAWQILIDGVKGAKSLDDQKVCDWLHTNGADTTFSGHLAFDPAQNNFWDTTLGIKQIQDGKWVLVWPSNMAAAPIQAPQG
jgi:branched-chain amino acid transport system substrate-binding protein